MPRNAAAALTKKNPTLAVELAVATVMNTLGSDALI